MEEAKKSILERYRAELEARDGTAPSGYVWRARGITTAAHAELTDGVPALPTGKKEGESEYDEASKKRWQAIKRAVYDRFVDGIVDLETGEVQKPEYGEVHWTDIDFAIDLAMTRAGLGTPKAAEIARGL